MSIEIQKNIPLAPLTTFKIGGPAKFFCEVSSEEELIEALQYARDNDLQFFILGGGSNVLVNDAGFDGLVIKIKFIEFNVDVEKNKITVGAGVPLSRVVRDSIANNFTGMEWAAGIPGTIGGAIRGNARAFGRNTGMTIESVSVLDINEMKEYVCAKEECQFEYFGSIFKLKPNLIILAAIIKLEKGNKDKSWSEAMDIIKKRNVMHPQESSPGSFFLNPVVADEKLRVKFEKDTGKVLGDGKIPAGWLIEEAGLKGKKMGGVMVSEKHANFVVNLGTGTAQDVIMLSSFIKMKIRDEFGVQLREEVQLVGF